MSRRAFAFATTATYLATGLAAFAPVLRAGFVADDWEFLFIVSRASSVAVCFEPLVGRFIRPLVVFFYYVHYHVFGLWPFPYHVTAVLVHVTNACLVCLLALRIDPLHRRFVGFATGLAFLLFAGHSEAIAWIAGIADALLALFVLAALLAFDAALRCERPWRFMLAGWALFAVGMLAKETSSVFPALAAAYGVLYIMRASPRAASVRRTIAFAGVAGAMVMAYLGIRAAVFGNPVAAYAGLGPQAANIHLLETRAFLLRSFLPPSQRVANLWALGYERPLLGLAAVALVAFLVWWKQERSALLYATASLAIALAPALPLSIAVNSSDTERVIYIPSVFACVLVVLVAVTLLRWRGLAVAALTVFIGVHTYGLFRSNRHWVEAGLMFDRVVQSLVEIHRAHDLGRWQRVFILNTPDDVKGAFVLRRGFHVALELVAPEVAPYETKIVGITSHTMRSLDDEIQATVEGPRRFRLNLNGNLFLQPVAPATLFYAFTEWSPTGYALTMSDKTGNDLVLYFSRGRLWYLATIPANERPFGLVDVPAGDTVCDGDSQLVQGWTLDDRDVPRVTIAREAYPSEAPPGGLVALGGATFATGARPDVARLFSRLPHADRAGWTYVLPCAVVRDAPDGTVRVHVLAADDDGHQVDLGVRVVRRRD